MATVMHLENVYRIFRMGQERIAAVDGITLDVNEGEILCMQGPSGSGKSTLLHMMAGLDRPSKGSVILGKTHIEKLSEDRLALFRQRHVGFIFQSYYLIPTLTALENVTLPLMFAGISNARRNKAGKELLAAVGLKDRMRHKPSEMSGGQQQRVSIARAFANNPRIVFADEPTGNLDTHTTYEMMNLMTRLARERNITLVIVTHDLEISGYATRLVKIRDGKVEGIADGPAHHAGAPPAVVPGLVAGLETVAAGTPEEGKKDGTVGDGARGEGDKAGSVENSSRGEGDKAGSVENSSREEGNNAGSVENSSRENIAAHSEPVPVNAGTSMTDRRKNTTGIFGKRKVQSK